MKNALILLLAISFLTSCGTYQNFNHQKFTNLSPLPCKSKENVFSLSMSQSQKASNDNSRLEIPSVDSDTIKLKDGSVIIADIYSSNIDNKPEDGVVGYKLDKESDKLTVSVTEIDTIIYDNKIQTKQYELTIDPAVTTEKDARSNYRRKVVYMILGIIMIPILAVFWALCVAVFALFWGIGWLISSVFGSAIDWPDSRYFLIAFLIAVGIGAIGTLIFLLVSNSFKKKPGVISKTKID